MARHMNEERHRRLMAAPIDMHAMNALDQAMRFYGVRWVLNALAQLTDRAAEKSVENFNTVAAKQWAAWSVALEALAESRKLTDPGRE